jgi:chorismate mutase
MKDPLEGLPEKVVVDEARLSTSLDAARRTLRDLDREIDEALVLFLRRRRHLVDVVWTIKEALGMPLIDPPYEAELDRGFEEGAQIPRERVAVLRAIREATRPR